MKPAAGPRPEPARERMLHVDPRTGARADHVIADLPRRLRPRDLLVVNDAATLPAALRARTAEGEEVEVRLAGENEDGTWTAVLFGAGDWRQRTEDRPPPPGLGPGARLALGPRLAARVERASPISPRLVDVRFDRTGAAFWDALYRLGRPVQYSYVRAPLALWDVQTAYATRPWAMEPPSAGRPLTAGILAAVRARGIGLAAVTHAAGLSSTGDPALDSLLPLPERYDVPAGAVKAIEEARARDGRIVAVGTTVVRALEGAAEDGAGELAARSGRTSLRLHSEFRPRVVDGLLTGVHPPGESHFDLLRAFCPEAVLREAVAHADREGYLAHEFGDSMLILPR